MTARPAWILSLILIAGFPCSSLALAEDGAFVDHAARQIACAYPPDPTATLLFLNKTRRIDLKKGARQDSETCWNIHPPLTLEGLGFTHVCASAEDPLLISLFPLLYYRGPGTSPGTGIRLVTDADRSAVDDWGKRIKERVAVAGDTKLAIGAPTFADGKTEVSCNSSGFLGE
ncbi:hypothetical protein [Taklimakanibacter lacteus]|uniref:hypothetical protein n=1 Tax=Taklimakanibacter lacteus TaxID=2268456 RepID=UPI0013C498CB